MAPPKFSTEAFIEALASGVQWCPRLLPSMNFLAATLRESEQPETRCFAIARWNEDGEAMVCDNPLSLNAYSRDALHYYLLVLSQTQRKHAAAVAAGAPVADVKVAHDAVMTAASDFCSNARCQTTHRGSHEQQVMALRDRLGRIAPDMEDPVKLRAYGSYEIPRHLRGRLGRMLLQEVGLSDDAIALFSTPRAVETTRMAMTLLNSNPPTSSSKRKLGCTATCGAGSSKRRRPAAPCTAPGFRSAQFGDGATSTTSLIAGADLRAGRPHARTPFLQTITAGNTIDSAPIEVTNYSRSATALSSYDSFAPAQLGQIANVDREGTPAPSSNNPDGGTSYFENTAGGSSWYVSDEIASNTANAPLPPIHPQSVEVDQQGSLSMSHHSPACSPRFSDAIATDSIHGTTPAGVIGHFSEAHNQSIGHQAPEILQQKPPSTASQGLIVGTSVASKSALGSSNMPIDLDELDDSPSDLVAPNDFAAPKSPTMPDQNSEMTKPINDGDILSSNYYRTTAESDFDFPAFDFDDLVGLSDEEFASFIQNVDSSRTS